MISTGISVEGGLIDRIILKEEEEEEEEDSNSNQAGNLLDCLVQAQNYAFHQVTKLLVDLLRSVGVFLNSFQHYYNPFLVPVVISRP